MYNHFIIVNKTTSNIQFDKVIKYISEHHIYHNITLPKESLFLDNYVFHPSNIYKIIWDIIIFIFIILSLILIPIEIGFDLNLSIGLDIINNYIIVILFVLDIIISFNTAYIDENDMYITDRKKIAIKYLKTYFIVDLLSAIPFHLFFVGKANKMLKLTNLFKVYNKFILDFKNNKNFWNN